MKLIKPNLMVTGEGTPVVMLHSSMSSKVQWYRLMQSLSKDFLAIAVDLYGYGDSPNPDPADHFTLSHEVQLLEELLSHVIGEEKIHIVGHSYGGAVGLCYSHKHRLTQKVVSLTVYEPVAFHLLDRNQQGFKNAATVAEKVLEYIQKNQYKEGAEYFIDHWNGPGTFAAFPDNFQELLIKCAGKIPIDFQALFNTSLSSEDYKALTLPVLLMAGTRSPAEGLDIIDVLRNTLPDNRLHWVEGGHMEPVNQPAVVNPIIEQFIRSQNHPLL